MHFDWRLYLDHLRDLQHRNSCIAVSLRQRLERYKLYPVEDRTSRYFQDSDFEGPKKTFDLKHFRKLRDEFQIRSLVYQEKLSRSVTSMSREVESNRNIFTKRIDERSERAFMVKDLKEDNTAKFHQISLKRSQLTEIKMAYEKVFNELLMMHANFAPAQIEESGMHRNLFKLLLEHKDLVHQQMFMKKQLHLFEIRLKATKIDIKNNRKHSMSDNTPIDIDRPVAGFAASPISDVAKTYSNLLQKSSAEMSAERSKILHSLGREFFSHWKDAQTLFSLSEALQHMATLRDIDLAVQFVMRAVCKLTECDRSSYWVIDKAKGIAWTKVNTFGGKKEDESSGLTTLMVPISSGLVGAAFASGKVLNIPDAYADSRFNRQVDLRTDYRTKSVLCYPIVYQGQVVGVTQCINKISPAASVFSPSDLAIVEALGNAMLSVLSSCHAHEEAKKQSVRRAVLVDAVDEMLTSMENRRELISLTRQKFKQLFKCNDFHFVLVYRDFFAKLTLDDTGGQIITVDADRDDGGLVDDCAAKGVPVHLFGQSALAAFASTLSKADSDCLKTGCLEKKIQNSASDVSVHSWPIFSSSRPDQVSAIVQWVALDRSVIGFGDDGTFNEYNSVHIELASKFIKLIGFFIERFWPSKYRLIWNKAKHLQLKVRGLVAFSFTKEVRSNPIRIENEKIRNSPPPGNRKYIDLWQRGKNWARDSLAFTQTIADPLKDQPVVVVKPTVPVAGDFMDKLRQENQVSLAKRRSVIVASASPEELEAVGKAAWIQRKSVLLINELVAKRMDRRDDDEEEESSQFSSSQSSSSEGQNTDHVILSDT